ncbi:YibL family ribosome-associated protein [Tatumella sp. UBA2305]|uniref:YibL family ribosome-associated protein n=1 Tax=Tatumella sp. UBA2305 TaxID=1947647 RepID=UPI0025D71615|nr:YibL family ribosome-associated protein [Tatumella sp. UBA2305]
MKEQEKAEIKRLSDLLDALNHKSQALITAGDMEKLGEIQQEIQTLETEITRLRNVREQKLSTEAQKLEKLPFRRVITRKEQANLGALKKTARGIVIVHPMTALGREMGLNEVTGFAKKAF